MQSIVGDRITVSTVLIAGHAGPDAMIRIADEGRGRFYNVQNAGQLPQIFIKEAAVILKSAIFEEPITPKLVVASELVPFRRLERRWWRRLHQPKMTISACP